MRLSSFFCHEVRGPAARLLSCPLLAPLPELVHRGLLSRVHRLGNHALQGSDPQRLKNSLGHHLLLGRKHEKRVFPLQSFAATSSGKINLEVVLARFREDTITYVNIKRQQLIPPRTQQQIS